MGLYRRTSWPFGICEVIRFICDVIKWVGFLPDLPTTNYRFFDPKTLTKVANPIVSPVKIFTNFCDTLSLKPSSISSNPLNLGFFLSLSNFIFSHLAKIQSFLSSSSDKLVQSHFWRKWLLSNLVTRIPISIRNSSSNLLQLFLKMF